MVIDELEGGGSQREAEQKNAAPSISSLKTLAYRALPITTSAGHGLLAAAW